MITSVETIDQILRSSQQYVLTIGNFDGMHLGHQAIVQRVIQIAKRENLSSAVLTFSNHPSEILRPEAPVCLLCLPSYKYRLLQQQGLEKVFALTFSPQLARLTAQEFLVKLRQQVAFSHLVLGHDATLGSERQGNKEAIEKIAKEIRFNVEYLPPVQQDGSAVSSSLIRNAIRQGRLDRAAHLLGRCYSLAGEIIPGLGEGRKLGFPTINIDVSRLCLPPYGVYGVRLKHHGQHIGIANLGIAPTIRANNTPLLEVYLFDHPNLAIAGVVEVYLDSFVRPEKKFGSIEELKNQIATDIAHVKFQN